MTQAAPSPATCLASPCSIGIMRGEAGLLVLLSLPPEKELQAVSRSHVLQMEDAQRPPQFTAPVL